MTPCLTLTKEQAYKLLKSPNAAIVLLALEIRFAADKFGATSMDSWDSLDDYHKEDLVRGMTSFKDRGIYAPGGLSGFAEWGFNAWQDIREDKLLE